MGWVSLREQAIVLGWAFILDPYRNQIEESKETKNPIKIAYKKKKRENENLITKISWFLFTIALTTKEEEEDVEIYKEKKI